VRQLAKETVISSRTIPGSDDVLGWVGRLEEPAHIPQDYWHWLLLFQLKKPYKFDFLVLTFRRVPDSKTTRGYLWAMGNRTMYGKSMTATETFLNNRAEDICWD
jgi:hypothetical protein